MTSTASLPDDSLSLDEYLRYGRQMIVPEFGLAAQLRLRRAAVLVIGAGGLGCPAIAYLAGAGVGKLTIVDGDTVEVSNLHRQVVHSQATVGEYKAVSAKRFVERLNKNVEVECVTEHFTAANAFEIVGSPSHHTFDAILDCTDNPATRYLVNDAAVLSGTPLVSASALKTEGQLCVLNYLGGPCYRCLFPTPPPASSVVACGDGGILGPVVGLMGVYQALEAIKVLTGVYYKDTGDQTAAGQQQQQYQPSLLLFSALSFPPWRCVKMRGKKPGCAVCDDTGSRSDGPKPITAAAIQNGEIDYATFCGRVIPDRVGAHERISATEFHDKIYSQQQQQEEEEYLLVDVRPATHFGICALEGSVNVPWDELNSLDPVGLRSRLSLATSGSEAPRHKPVYVVCRYGNDSQLAVKALKAKLETESVWDIVGGLNAWSDQVDPEFPKY